MLTLILNISMGLLSLLVSEWLVRNYEHFYRLKFTQKSIINSMISLISSLGFFSLFSSAILLFYFGPNSILYGVFIGSGWAFLNSATDSLFQTGVNQNQTD